MVDSNGYVDPSHLAMFAGVQVSKALVPLLTPAMDDFQARGFTFRAALPWGGYRPFGVQAGMKANPAAYGSSMEPGQIADAGKSTHGFGLSFDLVTNAPLATAVALMAAHGFDRPIAGDPNHYQPVGVNVLASPSDATFASTNQTSLTDTEEEDMAKPILIQNTQPGTTNYGMVVLLGDNGYWTWLSAAQRDAWVFKGVEVWACTSGHFEYFIQTSRDQAAYLANLVGKAVPAAPAAPAVGDDELKALIAGIPDAVVKAQGAALSNG